LADVLAKGAQPGEYEKVWKAAFYKKFSTLQRLQRLFLRNEFMIDLMMRIIKKPLIKEKVLLFWMDRYSLNVGVGFYFRVLKRVFLK
jgi:flavin-dependent dehydrogenase